MLSELPKSDKKDISPTLAFITRDLFVLSKMDLPVDTAILPGRELHRDKEYKNECDLLCHPVCNFT